MHQDIALVASLASLGLICAIYFCNVVARPGSWLRDELLTMVLLAYLVGAFTMATSALVLAFKPLLARDFALADLMSAGVDLVSLGAIVGAVAVFAATARTTMRPDQAPGNVTPLTPRPAAPIAPAQSMRKAA